jgi:serine/threonine-protein kinase
MRRFHLEAELAANLDHPNIVPIHDLGEHAGQHFYSMKLVDGGSLAREIPRLMSDPVAAARLLATVARALHFAHCRGFVHCDLKPANILLDDEGQPHVTDFGLARRVEGESTLTATGAVMGTPSYMAPEQAAGNRQAVSASADIYGLGAILYEILTGRPPFRAATQMETVLQVLEREPPLPSQLRPEAPRALETICLKCLERDPADRYPSAGALADDLEQYLRGEDVMGSSLWNRLRRWTRREPELVARLGGLFLVAALTQYNYLHNPRPRPGVHYTIQAVLLLWAASSVLFEFLLRRGQRSEWVRYVWSALDMTALTCLLIIVDGFETNLLVGYPLLIAASGLWFRVHLVWFTTVLAIASYGLLCAIAFANGGAAWYAKQYPNIFIASLGVTGFVVARQVKRIWALTTYYENRPRA